MIKIINTKELIKLYKKGYFPMAENAYVNNINFFLPKKRFIIPIEGFHTPRKLIQEIKKNRFEFKINSNFEFVIDSCAMKRRGESGTWINSIIKNTYIELHKEGYAKSIECYYNDKIVGGLYGIYIGKAFFGESMFSTISNTSKLCLVYLVSLLKENKFTLLDSQFFNSHLIQFGAYEISNNDYQLKLKKSTYIKSSFPTEFKF